MMNDRVSKSEPCATFRLSHTNVDGAGTIGYYAHLDDAKAEADARQARSDERGNPFGYSYQVWGLRGVVYRTKGGR
jgi:hypothetical protein